MLLIFGFLFLSDSMEFETISSFVSEGLIMSRFKHRNILRLFGLVIQPCAPPMIVMPYMKHGDLNQLLRNARATPRKPQVFQTLHLSKKFNFSSVSLSY